MVRGRKIATTTISAKSAIEKYLITSIKLVLLEDE